MTQKMELRPSMQQAVSYSQAQSQDSSTVLALLATDSRDKNDHKQL